MGEKKIHTLYLIRVGNFLKIGITKDLHGRLQKYYTDVPSLELVKTRPGTYTDERRLHDRFWHLHHSREWFVYDKSIVDGFDDYALCPKRVGKRPFRGNTPIDVGFLYR